jgi:hypothetical protein
MFPLVSFATSFLCHLLIPILETCMTVMLKFNYTLEK